MEIQDETEVKISSGVVDIVVDGVEEFISLNGYTYLNGTLELLEDEGIILNNVGGEGIEVINYFNYNKLKDDVEGKQDTITLSTDLSCNSLSTNQLIVNEDLYFDTIVIRRPTDVLNPDSANRGGIILNELQCWVNDENILPINSSTLVSYYALWDSDKYTDIGQYQNFVSERVYNNVFEDPYGTASPPTEITNTALIIREIPRTRIQDIQSLIVYNRVDSGRSIGLAIELYNRSNDPNLETPLASTEVITTTENVYRYDFPAIHIHYISFW